MRSFSNIFVSLLDLFRIPMTQYKHNGRIIRGIGKGFNNLFYNLGSEVVIIAETVIFTFNNLNFILK
jgi:hypothetical protein